MRCSCTVLTLLAAILLVLPTACTQEPTDLETATDLMVSWVDGWNASDPDDVAAVFTQDGHFADNSYDRTGRDQIRGHAVTFTGMVSNVWCGDGIDNGDGSFTFPAGFDFSRSESNTGTDVGEIVIRLEDDLIADMLFTHRAAG